MWYFAVNVPYCCSISEREDISSVNREMPVQRACSCALTPLVEVKGRWMARYRTIRDTRSEYGVRGK